MYTKLDVLDTYTLIVNMCMCCVVLCCAAPQLLTFFCTAMGSPSSMPYTTAAPTAVPSSTVGMRPGGAGGSKQQHSIIMVVPLASRCPWPACNSVCMHYAIVYACVQADPTAIGGWRNGASIELGHACEALPSCPCHSLRKGVASRPTTGSCLILRFNHPTTDMPAAMPTPYLASRTQ